jgi:type VI secretion system protein ImpK
VLLLDYASVLARDGSYREAEELLLSVAPEHLSARILDLLARIYAQQGRFPEAYAQWKRALEAEPHAQSYRDGVEALKRRRKYSLSAVAAACGVAASLLICLIVLLLPAVRHDGRSVSGQPTEGASPVKQPAPLPVRSIRLAGANVTESADGTRISFSDGLFSRGTLLTGRAKHLLRNLGEQVRECDCRIWIEGHTDGRPLVPRSPYRNNGDLGLARARAVAGLLQSAGVSFDRFVLSARPPAESGGGDDSGRRRSAVIRVEPARNTSR